MHQFFCRILPLAALVMIGATALAKDTTSRPAVSPRIQTHRPVAAVIEPLGKTIRLSFRIKEEETQRFSVTTATTEYGTSFSYTSQATSAFAAISGKIQFTDDKQKKLLVTAAFDLRYDDESGVYDATGKTSAMIALGDEVELLQQEAFTLTVEAELVD